MGVEFDEPLGHNDGSVKGVKVFSAKVMHSHGLPCISQPSLDPRQETHGAFVRGCNVEVGDFPEIDPFDGLSDEEL